MNDQAAADFVVIDVETACSRVSSICQIGIVGFQDGREVFAWETLLDPLDEFHAGNIRIHGIAAHRVVGQPTFADVHATINRHLAGRVTVAHSLFDKGALAAACRVHDHPNIETRWLDSVRVARSAWPDLDNHRLGGLARFLGVPHRHHDALSDARAAGWVIVRAIEHTGRSLAEWMAPPRQPGPAPKPIAEGPLSGERIAILGEPRDGPLAHAIAAQGGMIHSSVGLTTTMLVVAADEPYGRSVYASTTYRRAEKAANTRELKIVPARALGFK
jgi:DNA polymerase-3 subunit epsilon